MFNIYLHVLDCKIKEGTHQNLRTWLKITPRPPASTPGYSWWPKRKPVISWPSWGRQEWERIEPTCSYWNVWSTYFAQFYENGEKASGWNIKKLLSCLHRIFGELSSRQADYEARTEAISLDYPVQFCAHLWVENERVAIWAREIWPKNVEIINFWKVLPKNKKPGKQKIWIWANTSYDHFFSIQKDPIVSLKLQFYEDIAKTLNSFLVLYHTDNDSPAESLQTLFRSLCVKFVRKGVVESAKPDCTDKARCSW